jgi:predicted MFS family arabinose efflux permease
MVLLAAVALTDLPVLLAPVLAAACTAAGVVYPPAVAATMPRLVPDADLPVANAARSAIQSITIVAGPVAGAVLLLLGSPAMAFLFNALTFGGSAVLLLGLRRAGLFAPATAGGPATGMLGELWSGVVALRDNGFAARLVGADVVCSVVYGAHTVLLLLLAQRLGYGDAGYGYLLAGCGAGGVVGAFLAPRLSAARRPQRAVAAVLGAVALPAALLSATPWLAGAVVLAAAVGAASIMVEITTDTALARSLDEMVLARAYGLAFPASIGGIVVGSLAASPLVRLLGTTGALVAVAALAAGYACFLCLPTGPRRASRPVDTMLVDAVR